MNNKPYFLPSEVARLVLGYLTDLGLAQTTKVFLKECKDLSEYNELKKRGYAYPTDIMGLNLVNMLDNFGFMKTQALERYNSCSSVDSLWRDIEALLDKLKYRTFQNLSSNTVATISKFRTQRKVQKGDTLTVIPEKIGDELLSTTHSSSNDLAKKLKQNSVTFKKSDNHENQTTTKNHQQEESPENLDCDIITLNSPPQPPPPPNEEEITEAEERNDEDVLPEKRKVPESSKDNNQATRSKKSGSSTAKGSDILQNAITISGMLASDPTSGNVKEPSKDKQHSAPKKPASVELVADKRTLKDGSFANSSPLSSSSPPPPPPPPSPSPPPSSPLSSPPPPSQPSSSSSLPSCSLSTLPLSMSPLPSSSSSTTTAALTSTTTITTATTTVPLTELTTTTTTTTTTTSADTFLSENPSRDPSLLSNTQSPDQTKQSSAESVSVLETGPSVDVAPSPSPPVSPSTTTTTTPADTTTTTTTTAASTTTTTTTTSSASSSSSNLPMNSLSLFTPSFTTSPCLITSVTQPNFYSMAGLAFTPTKTSPNIYRTPVKSSSQKAPQHLYETLNTPVRDRDAPFFDSLTPSKQLDSDYAKSKRKRCPPEKRPLDIFTAGPSQLRADSSNSQDGSYNKDSIPTFVEKVISETSLAKALAANINKKLYGDSKLDLASKNGEPKQVEEKLPADCDKLMADILLTDFHMTKDDIEEVINQTSNDGIPVLDDLIKLFSSVSDEGISDDNSYQGIELEETNSYSSNLHKDTGQRSKMSSLENANAIHTSSSNEENRINRKAPRTFLQIVDKLCPDESSSHSQDNSLDQNSIEEKQQDDEVPSSCNISSPTDNQPDVQTVESSSKIGEILPSETESEHLPAIQNKSKDSKTCKNFTSMEGREGNSIQSPVLDNQVSSPQMSTAKEVSSAAVGVSSAAVGVSSTAAGVSSTAAGVSSTAVGVSSTAVGVSSTAVGVSSTAAGVSSAAVGVSSTTTTLSTDTVIQPTDDVRDFCEHLLTNTSASPSSSCVQQTSSSNSSKGLKCPVKTTAVARLTYTSASTSTAEGTTPVASKSNSLKASDAPQPVPVAQITNSNLRVLSHTKDTSGNNVPFTLSLPFQPVQCLTSTVVPSTNHSFVLLTPSKIRPPSADSNCEQPVPKGGNEIINTPSVAPAPNSFPSNVHVVRLQPNNTLQPSSLNAFSLKNVPSSGAPNYSNVNVAVTTAVVPSQNSQSFKTRQHQKEESRQPTDASSATQKKLQPIAMMKPAASLMPSKVVTLSLPIVSEETIVSHQKEDKNIVLVRSSDDSLTIEMKPNSNNIILKMKNQQTNKISSFLMDAKNVRLQLSNFIGTPLLTDYILNCMSKIESASIHNCDKEPLPKRPKPLTLASASNSNPKFSELRTCGISSTAGHSFDSVDGSKIVSKVGLDATVHNNKNSVRDEERESTSVDGNKSTFITLGQGNCKMTSHIYPSQGLINNAKTKYLSKTILTGSRIGQFTNTSGQMSGLVGQPLRKTFRGTQPKTVLGGDVPTSEPTDKTVKQRTNAANVDVNPETGDHFIEEDEQVAIDILSTLRYNCSKPYESSLVASSLSANSADMNITQQQQQQHQTSNIRTKTTITTSSKCASPPLNLSDTVGYVHPPVRFTSPLHPFALLPTSPLTTPNKQTFATTTTTTTTTSITTATVTTTTATTITTPTTSSSTDKHILSHRDAQRQSVKKSVRKKNNNNKNNENVKKKKGIKRKLYVDDDDDDDKEKEKEKNRKEGVESEISLNKLDKSEIDHFLDHLHADSLDSVPPKSISSAAASDDDNDALK
ncbi:wall DAN4 isoform X1 [Octopus vulgaris]|uniref:Wall DAN4 isoform X1 n=1 Tax=Octopus vulgaris TaxID=6645 RepID=A0AA36BUF6_OCTVU|nr:wall DAN4 isoform X1 [Octopus vulgaris]